MSLTEYRPGEVEERLREGTLLAPIFNPSFFEHMQRIAKLMAFAPLIPQHLRASNLDATMANCFLVVNQALKWRMDPFAVAQETFVREGKIGYSGKLVAAALESCLGIKLYYYFFGEPGTDSRGILVRDKPRGEETERELKGTVAEWRTKTKDGHVNFNWANQPDDMLIYRGTRQWCRRYEPSVILGVLTDDELHDIAANNARDITPREQSTSALVSAPVPPPPPPPPSAPSATAQPPAAPADSPPTNDEEPVSQVTPQTEVIEAEVIDDEPLPDPNGYLSELDQRMSEATSADELEEIWSSHIAIAHRIPLKHQNQARRLHFEQRKRFATGEVLAK